MSRLLIQFADETLTDFRWASFDESAEFGGLDWHSNAADQLTAVATQNPHPVIMLVPQQCVYLTQVELPEKASRQLMAAIEYQVEDQLAQDIETQHFALGDSSKNPIAIAVVSRSIMEDCMALARSHDLRLIQVVPELFLCPWQGEGIALTEGYDGCLLRYGDYSGLKCQAQALPAMLALVKRDLDSDQITYYASGDDPAPELEGYEVQRQSLNATRPGLVDAPLIDLQQRDFQLSSAWLGLAKTWKWVALLFAALLVIGAYNKAIALYELETELADIRQQQFELLKPHLSAADNVDANLKKLLIDHLKKLRLNQREQGFLKLLLEFTRARTAYPGVEISRVAYQGSRLSFDINSNQLTDIEALTEAVRKLGLNVKLESLSIKPEQSSGRLVLTGADDV